MLLNLIYLSTSSTLFLPTLAPGPDFDSPFDPEPHAGRRILPHAPNAHPSLHARPHAQYRSMLVHSLLVCRSAFALPWFIVPCLPPLRALKSTLNSSSSASGCLAEDNLEMILHEFVLENVETELWRKWKNQG